MKLTAALGLALLTSAVAQAQLTLVETRGTFRTDDTNLAASATPAGTTQYGDPHFITNINDGLYGNAHSWLGVSSFNDIIGLGFTAPVTIGSIAFGRDNTGEYLDRTDTYFDLQYSLDYVAGSSIGTGNWLSVPGGLLNYRDSPPLDPSYRHLYNLGTPLSGVTGLRFVVPSLNNPIYAGAVIDEVEVYATSFTASAIPEPSTYAALLGACALGFAAWRKRRTREV